jgi:hypothetical protein
LPNIALTFRARARARTRARVVSNDNPTSQR